MSHPTSAVSHPLRAALGTATFVLLLLAGTATAPAVAYADAPTGALVVGCAVGLTVGWRAFPELRRDLREQGPKALLGEGLLELAACILIATAGVALVVGGAAVLLATLVLA